MKPPPDHSSIIDENDPFLRMIQASMRPGSIAAYTRMGLTLDEAAERVECIEREEWEQIVEEARQVAEAQRSALAAPRRGFLKWPWRRSPGRK